MQGAWCVKGDFNAMLHPGERIVGEKVTHKEIKDFAGCLEKCELAEVRITGSYFT